MKYRICERCGMHLDFGEKCECVRDSEKEADDEKEKLATEGKESGGNNDAVRH